MTDWAAIRKQFPALENFVYLDAAEASPLPTSVTEAGKKYYDQMQEKGILDWEFWENAIQQTREKVAKHIHADPEEIAFTLSTSHGMNIFADMLLGKGRVVTMEDEYPTSTIPWIHKGYDVDFVSPINNTYPLDEIQKQIKEDTKIFVTSHVEYNTGFQHDLESLGNFCKQRDMFFVVNATQSFGAVPIDVKTGNIDFMCFSGYKWGFTGFGIGVMYINKKWFGTIPFPQAGGESVENWGSLDNKNYTLRKDASELEIGTLQQSNVMALQASLDVLSSLGIENIYARIVSLTSFLIEELQKRNIPIITPLEEKYRSGIVVIDIPNPGEMREALEKRNIIVSKRNKGLRISVHFYNNEEDIQKFLEALDTLL